VRSEEPFESRLIELRRWFWSISILLSLIALEELIRNLVLNMHRNPIIFYIDDVPLPVTDIYFPAVTVCPGLLMKNSKEVLIDYEKVTEDLEAGRIDRKNLTQLE
jgi:hypothetical protein